jgi:hypothetical protein
LARGRSAAIEPYPPWRRAARPGNGRTQRLDIAPGRCAEQRGVLAADLYLPKNASGGKLAALAVCGPFGAVKEQFSRLYAQTLAERGYVAVAFDPSFTGESGGEPRSSATPKGS